MKMPRVTDPPKGPSVGRIALLMAPFWLLVVPISIVLSIIALPWTIVKSIFKPSTTTPLTVQITGPEEDKSKGNILFIHGWPDSGNLWKDQAVAFAAAGYRCLVVTMPNYDGKGAGWGHDFDEIDAMLLNVVTANCPRKPKVTLFLHDWGCTIGYAFSQAHRELVSRIVCLDVGGHIAMNPGMTLFVLGYQWYNVLAFLLGGPGGNLMNYAFLRATYEARPLSEAGASLNYMYYYFWRRIILQRTLKPLGHFTPALKECPIWYGYGRRKLAPFHSNKWLSMLESEPTCHVEKFDCDHWITVHKSKELNTAVLEWFNKSQ